MTLRARVLGFVMVGLLMSTPAYAVSTLHALMLNQVAPTTELIEGSFEIDDSLLGAGNENTFIAFDQFISFGISVSGIDYTLADSSSPAVEGVITDGLGEVLRFADVGGGARVEFCSGSCLVVLRFTDNTFEYDSRGGTPSPTSGTYEIAIGRGEVEPPTNPVPEPGASALFGAGCLIVGRVVRRKNAS